VLLRVKNNVKIIVNRLDAALLDGVAEPIGIV